MVQSTLIGDIVLLFIDVKSTKSTCWRVIRRSLSLKQIRRGARTDAVTIKILIHYSGVSFELLNTLTGRKYMSLLPCMYCAHRFRFNVTEPNDFELNACALLTGIIHMLKISQKLFLRFFNLNTSCLLHIVMFL